MIRLHDNEISEILKENRIDNIYENAFINQYISIFDESDIEWIREAFSLLPKDDVEQITSISALNAKIDSVANGEPKNVIRILRFFKIITLLLNMAVGAAATYTISTKVFGNESWVPKHIGQAIVMALGVNISVSLFNQIISDKFIDKLAGKIARMINDCRTSDQEKVRLYNELIKSIDKTVNKSKDPIARETLYDAMNKVIELRDQVSSRLHVMNKGARPIENENKSPEGVNNNES